MLRTAGLRLATAALQRPNAPLLRCAVAATSSSSSGGSFRSSSSSASSTTADGHRTAGGVAAYDMPISLYTWGVGDDGQLAQPSVSKELTSSGNLYIECVATAWRRLGLCAWLLLVAG